ncbi:MAG: PIN domain nuclease, partial [Smithellaceae bacterium]|nr:PIN domain nuclease [Smithellaceae bacterium]
MLFRFLLILACSISGFFLGLNYFGDPYSPAGALAGLLLALTFIHLEQLIHKIQLKSLIGGIVGSMSGLILAVLISQGIIALLGAGGGGLSSFWIVAMSVASFGYLGTVVGIKRAPELSSLVSFFQGKGRNKRIIDTSVIIDGRIIAVCESGFLKGTITVPRFVLNELQFVADSVDPLKRARGRRGLDILSRMQKMEGIKIEFIDDDFPKIKGVDAKLVALAIKYKSWLITNDFNLDKVAELQGIKVLNINRLANAVKPVVLPGETMMLKIVKEGNEPGQGVAYLEDGTMVVVDNAHKMQGMIVEVYVTSLLQTSAGRMIFCALKEVASEKKPYVI